MDPVRNPFSPGAGTRPPALVGREREIEALDTALQRPVRNGLLKKALCYSPRWGEIDFTVPMFDSFMRRWIPDLRQVVPGR